jgi:hypothetical protein
MNTGIGAFAWLSLQAIHFRANRSCTRLASGGSASPLFQQIAISDSIQLKKLVESGKPK